MGFTTNWRRREVAMSGMTDHPAKESKAWVVPETMVDCVC